MTEKPPTLPDVWQGDDQPAPTDSPKDKIVKVKTIKLGPLGAYSRKTLYVIAGVLLALLAVAIGWIVSRPQKPVILGTLDRAIAVSSDGSRLLLGMRDGSVRVLDIASSKTLATAQLGAPILAVTFGPRDAAIVLADAGVPLAVDAKATESQPTLQILTADLSSRVRRRLQPNAHDVIWSDALQSAIVLSGGDNDLHASLEIFADRPMGIATSTPDLIELPTYTSPRHLAVSGDGTRIAVTFATIRHANLLIFNLTERHIVNSLRVPGSPAGVAINFGATAVSASSPDSGSITRVTGRRSETVNVAPNSSTWPASMIAMDPDGRKAYTTGALDVPEADFESGKVMRGAELLPGEHHASSSLVLSPDGKTLYVTFQDRNGVGVVDAATMQWLRKIELH